MADKFRRTPDFDEEEIGTGRRPSGDAGWIGGQGVRSPAELARRQPNATSVQRTDPLSGRVEVKSYAADESWSAMVADQRVLWVPSQTGALEDRLQPQKKTFLVFSAVYFTGVKAVTLWLPSQKG